MKKLLLLVVLFTATYVAQAQAGDPPSMLEQMKEKQAPGLIEKAGFTKAQADKVIELNYEMRMKMLDYKDLSDADRSKKIAELRAEKEKKFAEFLTPELIKAMNDYHAEMAKNAPKRPGN